MALGHAPKTSTNGLVFYYDTENFRKSWRGAPTTNIVTNWDLDTGWSKDYCTNIIFNEIEPPYGVDAPTVGFTDADGNGSGYWYSYGNYASGQTPGSTMTVSLYVKVRGPACTIRCYTADNSETGRVYGSSITVNQAEGWKRCVWTIVIPNPSTSESLSFVFDTFPASTRMWLCAPQMQSGSYATPFVKGTRSNTQALLDLTNNNTITATSLTYNSDGSFDFNGTNNEMTISGTAGSFFTNYSQPITLDVTVNIPSAATWSNGTNYGEILSRGDYAGSTGIWRTTANNEISAYFRQSGATFAAVECKATIERDVWTNIVASWTGSTLSLYVNGDLKTTSSGSLGTPTVTNWSVGTVSAASGNVGNRFQGKLASIKIYNRAFTANEVKQNYSAVKSKWPGSSINSPARTATEIITADPKAVNGSYWILPLNYSGSPEYVYVDFDGSVSGITDPGPWIRIRYAQDYYSQAAPWRNTGISTTNPGAFSGDFAFEQDSNWIHALLNNSTETRQRFESWGNGSVGWTYANGEYMGVKTFADKEYNGATTSNIIKQNKPAGISHGVTDFNTFNNPTAQGTDPTDTNDAVWRAGVFYFRDTSGNKILPIKGIWNADVDTAAEQRYFPFRTGEAVPGVNSDIWIKLK